MTSSSAGNAVHDGKLGPSVSVVIPTCDRVEDLARCLGQLAEGRQIGMKLKAAAADDHGATGSSSGRLTYEVIVTDDGRACHARELIRERFPWVNWVQGPRRGPAANRNHGARSAAGPWIAFTDDDCLPDGLWLKSFAAAWSGHPLSGVLEGRTCPEGRRTHPLQDAPVNEQGGLLWSCNFCIKKSLFDEVGGFDERFPFAAMEDMDLKSRLHARRAGMVFVRDALVRHPWKTIDLKRHWKRHLKSQMIYLQLHPEEKALFSFGSFLKSIGRYYVRSFPGELKSFGLLAVKVQPVRWHGFLLQGYVSLFHPAPENMKA